MQIAINTLALSILGILGYGSVAGILALDFTAPALMVYSGFLSLILTVLNITHQRNVEIRLREDLELTQHVMQDMQTAKEKLEGGIH